MTVRATPDDRCASPDRAEVVVDQLAAALGPGPVERRETHGSWVLLTGSRAYKVKKPVVMAFLDYGTLAKRREMCRLEVEVNRRAAPDVYLGVRAVVPVDGGVALAAEDAPDAIEYVVEMRRFCERATLAAGLEAGSATVSDLGTVGRRIAAFHARCPVVTLGAGAEAVKRSLDDDFASLCTLLSPSPAGLRRLQAAERSTIAFLASRWRLLDERARDGHVRDGHGDLRAEHVLVGPDEALVDAVEFDSGLRRIDVGLDLAFLVMELHAAGRADLAGALVAGYRDAGGDPGDDGLLACFAAYRARVRAKVALLRAGQLAPGSPAAAAARARADRLLTLGEQLLWSARGPRTVIVSGVTASGKSTLARALAARSGVPHLSSDVVRKRLLGLQPGERAPASAYAAEITERTYRELGRLSRGDPRGAVVDATFHRRALRAAFREELGDAAEQAFFVECRAPVAELERRLRARAQNPHRASDATPAVLRRQLARREPLDEVEAGRHLIVRSDLPAEQLVETVADALDRLLGGAGAPPLAGGR